MFFQKILNVFISICKYFNRLKIYSWCSRARDCARPPVRYGTSTDRLGMPRTVKIFTCRSLPDTWRCRVCTRRSGPKTDSSSDPLAQGTFPTLLKYLSLAESQSPTASPRHKTQHSDSRRLRAIVDGRCCCNVQHHANRKLLTDLWWCA